MDFRDTPAEAAFRDEVRTWLSEHLVGEFAEIGPGGGPADESGYDLRIEWERLLGQDRWVGLSWPKEYGGRDAGIVEQVIFNEEYAKAGAPARISFFGEGLFAPTLIAYGTEDQKQRFLPKIQAVDELWCQGYSEPNAGSDLSNVQTRAVLDGDEWVINGQKVWTTLAHRADWCFCICRTDPDAPAHKGLSYVLIPMHQPGVTVAPIHQMTGTAEFNEVFFDDARTAAVNVVGAPGDGWRIAKATLAIERGAAMLGQQVGFRRDFEDLAEAARRSGASGNPLIRDRLARAWIGLRIIREYALDTLGTDDPARASMLKVLWSRWHRDLGELAMDIVGPGSPDLHRWQRLFLFSRAETIYGGSDEIQHEIIATRALGLPRS
jgi:alkylation response protein AidB-like acyl-CoA dehydrogenase